MNLHIVGGFLGSGKTTAIAAAARMLMAAGQRVGVVTNDQGKYLVDAAFFDRADVPTTSVTGGCFCCNYDDLAARLESLQESARPDVIFAESVGSCADLVATVIKPLLTLPESVAQPSSFSVFVDSRLLQRRLAGETMPYGENVVYIFDKQIEEAGLLIINKSDLLAAAEQEALLDAAKQRYPQKQIRLQSALESDSVAGWLAAVQAGADVMSGAQSLQIDYGRYGAGEAEMAWLDQALLLYPVAGRGRRVLRELLTAVAGALGAADLPLGHVKFLIDDGQQQVKISLPISYDPDWQPDIPALADGRVALLINARVEVEATALGEIVNGVVTAVLQQRETRFEMVEAAAFHPGFPRPTHRL